ncbi:NAD(FAD)-utilizing dehydrogenases [Agrilactobacillus composti DSM 18527 = JCM 14202]|nr:NAD(FAD)-utilizing dehydrogenases [Agrilactobacillus composti DSM 18527 = JCM 14202]
MLYGYDAKFYPTQVKTNAQFETGIPGLYCIGDCSGATYSLAQAAASGVYLGQIIAK